MTAHTIRPPRGPVIHAEVERRDGAIIIETSQVGSVAVGGGWYWEQPPGGMCWVTGARIPDQAPADQIDVRVESGLASYWLTVTLADVPRWLRDLVREVK